MAFPRKSYAPLIVFSNYSFLEGASFPEELALQAAAFDLPAIAITDKDGFYGIVRAHVATRDCGVHLVVGATLTRNDGPPLVVLVKDKEGYFALATLISQGRHQSDKGTSFLSTPQLLQWLSPEHHFIIHPALSQETHLPLLLPRFKDALFASIARYMLPDDETRISQTEEAARKAHVPLVVAPFIYFHSRERKELADVLTAIRNNLPLNKVQGRILPNNLFTLLPPSVMVRLYHDYPDPLQNSTRIAKQCRFSLNELQYHYPHEVVPDGISSMQHLHHLTWEGARNRYPKSLPPDVTAQLERELNLIEELNYANYFLTMHDIVRFARSRNILCQGRGSAANSAVCYVLKITSVDPARSNLLFERFISRERNEPPDIDVDFEHERREEVIQYIYQRYGRQRASMVAEFIRYRTKSAIRDVGKALGFSVPQLDRLATMASSYRRDHDNWWERAVVRAGMEPEHPKLLAFQRMIKSVQGFPRHLSIHVGGFVISDLPIHHLVPTEPARMEGRTVIQWDKEDVEDARLLKIDILGLGMLSCIRRSFDLLKEDKKIDLDLATVPAEDPDTYDMITQGDTLGVFQIESRAQMSMLPRLRPKTFYDLVVEIAIVRPGPIQGKMVHPYLRRRQGLEPVTYPLPELEPVLARTFGVPLFQEQVMQLAMVAAGFTPGEADALRRAMGTWRSNGKLEGLLSLLKKRMQDRGIRPKYADQIANQIKGFGEYGFPESHAASFALLAYASAWLKRHHPDAFAAALLNSQPMGFYSPATIVEDARRHGVQVRPMSIQHSHWESSLESNAETQEPTTAPKPLRIGFSLLRSAKREAMEVVLKERRNNGPFSGLDNLIRRTHLERHLLLKLALAGALSDFGLERRQALWEVLRRWTTADSLFFGQRTSKQPPSSDPMPPLQLVMADLDATRTYQAFHPFELVKEQVEGRKNYVNSRQIQEIQNGRWVATAGLVIVKQRPPTAKGVTFLTLEDHLGLINVVVSAVQMERHRQTLLEEALLWVEGKVETVNELVNLQATRIRGITLTENSTRIQHRSYR